MNENMLYIHKIEECKYNEKERKVEYKLSKEFVAFDKGRAIYYMGFSNQFILIGFLRTLFNEPLKSEILQTANKLGDVFVVGNHGMMAVWTGKWEPLERIGFIGVTFHNEMLQAMIREIYLSLEQNKGKLVDRW